MVKPTPALNWVGKYSVSNLHNAQVVAYNHKGEGLTILKTTTLQRLLHHLGQHGLRVFINETNIKEAFNESTGESSN